MTTVGAINFDFKTKGFAAFLAAIDPAKFNRLLQKHVGMATKRNGLIMVKSIRENIRRKVTPKNAALTILIKRSSSPGIDHGGLFGAVTSVVQRWDRCEVGVLRTHKMANIAEILQKGAVIPVTEKMRMMFKMLAWVSDGTMPASRLRGRAAELWGRRQLDWKPLRETTFAIIIPPRDLFKKPFDDPAIKDQVLANWRQAVQDAIDEMVRTAPRGKS